MVSCETRKRSVARSLAAQLLDSNFNHSVSSFSDSNQTPGQLALCKHRNEYLSKFNKRITNLNWMKWQKHAFRSNPCRMQTQMELGIGSLKPRSRALEQTWKVQGVINDQIGTMDGI